MGPYSEASERKHVVVHYIKPVDRVDSCRHCKCLDTNFHRNPFCIHHQMYVHSAGICPSHQPKERQ